MKETNSETKGSCSQENNTGLITTSKGISEERICLLLHIACNN